MEYLRHYNFLSVLRCGWTQFFYDGSFIILFHSSFRILQMHECEMLTGRGAVIHSFIHSFIYLLRITSTNKTIRVDFILKKSQFSGSTALYDSAGTGFVQQWWQGQCVAHASTMSNIPPGMLTRLQVPRPRPRPQLDQANNFSVKRKKSCAKVMRIRENIIYINIS